MTFTPIVPLLDAFDELIEDDIESSHYVKVPLDEEWDMFLDYDDASEDAVMDIAYDY